jgi:hypothetical protein
MAVGLDVVFSGASTGWSFSQDGLTIAPLSADAVTAALTHVRNDEYCALDGSKDDGTPVPYLDTVPTSIRCFPWQSGVAVGGQPGLSTAMD